MSNTIGTNSEFSVLDAQGDRRMIFRFNGDGDLQIIRCNSSGVEQATVLTIDSETGAVVMTGDLQPAATSIAGAADAAVAIVNTTTEIILDSASGAKAITTTSSYAGQQLYIRAATVSGGSYTLAVTGGTLTLNSAGELAVVKRNAANDAWIVMALTASTSTGANIATIV